MVAGPGNPDAADNAFGDDEASERNTHYSVSLPNLHNVDPESNKVDDVTSQVMNYRLNYNDPTPR